MGRISPCMLSFDSVDIHSLSITALFLLWRCGFFCWSQSQLSLGEGRVLPGQVASSWQGPRWWQRPPCKVPTAPGAIWGSVSCSRTLRHVAQLSPELGFEPATFRSLANLLYPLSYSRPDSVDNFNQFLVFSKLMLEYCPFKFCVHMKNCSLF